ncbi:cytochrome c oxidase subunit II [Actinophytocola glycyrrhizae]|uniref:cytochrome-c oxidase n=1 Tax=Actinophytocola glycyrrhizae TaxID=2044873 RepID=A0ABV9SG37_9PSEU
MACAWTVLLLAGCSASAPSTLEPAGPGARRVEGLWWLLFWISLVVYVIVMAVLVVALLRRRRRGPVNRGDATRFVVVAGVVLPFLVLTSVYLVGLRDMDALSQPEADRASDVEVTVVGHQWWWEVRYPGSGAVTANEVHIPVGVDVRLDLTTADVLHSFWVPELMPKTDMISGRTNTTWLHADRPGTYRGHCAEYCGLQHGNMAFHVVAQPRAEFDAWLARAARPAPEPDTAAERRGLAVFEQTGCAACHTIRGTSADGTVGPDLTTIGSRWSIGAGAAPNTPGDLGGWVVDPRTIKPGNLMPPQPVPAQELPDLIAYLRSLK